MVGRDAERAWSRRGFLRVVGTTTAAGVGLSGGWWVDARGSRAAAATGGDDFAALRAAWREVLTGGEVDIDDPVVAAALAELDATAAEYLSLLDRSSGRDSVFVDLALSGDDFAASSRMRDTFQRLEHLATAFATTGSRYEGDTGVLGDVLAGLETVNLEVYNDSQPQFGTWFHFQVSGPHALGNTCVLVYEHIPAEALDRYVAAIDHFVPQPSGTGANRVDLCQTVLVRGVIGNNAERIQTARDALSPVFRYVTSGDGFYRDGSFVFHAIHAYTGGYGVQVLGGNANLGITKQMAILAGSPWEITGADQQFVFAVVDRAYAPVVYDGQVLDCVRGRNISRDFQTGHDRGREVTEAITRLARAAANPETAARWRAMCKGWLERNTFQGPYAGAKPARVAVFKQLLDDPSLPASAEQVGHALFAGMDRAVHRRPGWAYAIAMSSRRIAYYESINSENVKGFHTGDGMTYLYNSDNGHYSDAFWPTVDPYRLPGITVDTVRLPDRAGGGAPRPQNATWVGGAVIGGEYAAVGMDAEPLMTSLRAKKSWFCLDGAIVALGAGITGGGADHPVETIVENRNLGADGINPLTIDGETQPVEQGWSSTGRVDWAHLAGVAGYVFPGRATVHALREERTGAWSDIGNLSGQAPTDPITRRYLTMWFDHGVQPQDATYAYVLLPGATPEQTAQLARNPAVEIVANTAEIQAVRVNHLDLIGVNFWAPGTIGGITVTAPCSLLISGWRPGRPEPMTIAVADPTQELETLDVQVAAPGFGSYEAEEAITVAELSPVISLTATLGPPTVAVLSTTPAWYELDVTGHVQRELAAGRDSIALAIRNPTRTNPAIFVNSREAGSNPPQLRINGASTYQAIADAHVRGGSFADTNFGTSARMELKTHGTEGATRWVYLKFDLASVGEVTDARLRLFAWLSPAATAPISTAVYPVADTNWSETGITWSTKPDPADVPRSFGATHTVTFHPR